MTWARIVAIAFSTIGPLVVDLVGGLVDGDAVALHRVSTIIPTPLRGEAKLLQEAARLRRLDDV